MERKGEKKKNKDGRMEKKFITRREGEKFRNDKIALRKWIKMIEIEEKGGKSKKNDRRVAVKMKKKERKI